jgi:hypothetical protein
MPLYIEGQDRIQAVLLPECLDDFIGQDCCGQPKQTSMVRIRSALTPAAVRLRRFGGGLPRIQLRWA